MKTSKIILLTTITIVVLFFTVSCGESLALSKFVNATSNIEQAAASYNQTSLSGTLIVDSIASESTSATAIKLSETNDALVEFNELRLEIINLHDQIVSLRDSIKTLASSIRTSAQAIQESGYILLEGDKSILQDYASSLRSMREGIVSTKGDAYQRIYDLQGSYTRDNLEEINQVFQEVISVLEYRLETFQDAKIILENADMLLKDYLEI